MTETLTVTGLLVVALFALLMLSRPRKTMAGDMEVPMDLERGRAHSEAEMAAAATQVLPAAEAGEAAVLVAFHRDLGTSEQRLVPVVRRRRVVRRPARWQRVAMRRRFGADPLAASIPGRHRQEDPVLFGDAVESWFTPHLVAAPSYPAPPAEPAPWLLDGFTGEWEAGTFNVRKAGAQR